MIVHEVPLVTNQNRRNARKPFKLGLREVLTTLKLLFTSGGTAWDDQLVFSALHQRLGK